MITHVAFRMRGTILSLPAPNRHCHLIWANLDEYGKCHCPFEDSGFLDDKGNFLGRREAMEHAIACGQIPPDKVVSVYLYSEDVWPYMGDPSLLVEPPKG